jgi:hypothetical protein
VRSALFYSDAHKLIEQRTAALLQRSPELLSEHTAESTRAVGDAVQAFLSRHFEQSLGELARSYQTDFARRAMADIAFEDQDGMYYLVDIKTHRLDTRFNMPNLTSVERLTRLYEDDRNVFALLIVDYTVIDNALQIAAVRFFPIEFLAWECLTIGALGWGQTQITDANRLVLQKQSRRTWMLSLCEHVLRFYPREIAKINERIAHFERVQRAWSMRDDLWT